MVKRKKRNAITLVSLLLALGILIGVYAWYTNRPKDDVSNEVTPTIDLATIDTAKLSTLHYVKGDADIVLTLKDNVWVSKDEPGRPINQEYMKTILYAINDINADQVIMENPENLEDYGLAEPVALIEATMTDGSAITVKLGNPAGDSGGYYGMVNEDGTVYLMPIELGAALQYDNTQMTAVEESPEITAENIHYISITNRDGEDYELKLMDNSGMDESGSEYYQWRILKPYGAGVSADTSKVSEIQSNYTNFQYISCVDYQGKDLEKYGLDNPTAIIDIGYYENATEQATATDLEYKVILGNKDEAGNYYMKKDDSKAIYTISASSIDTMLQIDTFHLMNPYICIPNIDNVDQIVFDREGTTDTLEIKRSTQKSSEGEAETAATYYYNGSKVKEDAFKALYQVMVSQQYDAELKKEVDIAGIVPYITMSFHLNGEKESTITASFLPYNDSFYLVQKDDKVRFLADKRKIDDLVVAMSAFTEKTQED